MGGWGVGGRGEREGEGRVSLRCNPACGQRPWLGEGGSPNVHEQYRGRSHLRAGRRATIQGWPWRVTATQCPATHPHTHAPCRCCSTYLHKQVRLRHPDYESHMRLWKILHHKRISKVAAFLCRCLQFAVQRLQLELPAGCRELHTHRGVNGAGAAGICRKGRSQCKCRAREPAVAATMMQ